MEKWLSPWPCTFSWQPFPGGSLIAVNHNACARACGGCRRCAVAEAKTVCPSPLIQHVAPGARTMAGRTATTKVAANMATRKVSRDPHHLASRKVLAPI